MLGIKADFRLDDIKKDIDSFIKNVEDNLTDSLRKAGKLMVDRARMKTKAGGGFGNITWDLRGSIGYVIVKDHVIIETYFPQTANGAQGVTTGIAYAQEIALLIDDGGIILVVVAGMEYAYFVEATDDHDVISGSISHLTNELQKLLR